MLVAVTVAITPAVAQNCRTGPPPHTKGALVFVNYDQIELDAAYDQALYEPLGKRVDRLASNSIEVRQRIGKAQRVAYGPTPDEKLEIYRTDRPKHRSLFLSTAGRGAGDQLRERAFDRVNHAGELDERAITHQLDDSAVVVSDFWG